MSENYIVINGKKVDLTEEQLEKLGIKAEKSKRWRAKNGETYWLAVPSMRLNAYVVDSDEGCDDGVTYVRYYTHNHFRTKEEAQKYADVLNTEMELMKYADEHNGNFEGKYWKMYYSDVENNIDFCFETSTSCYPRAIRFSDYETAKKAIEAIGEERVIKYLIYEW